jgi:hypothetical protein
LNKPNLDKAADRAAGLMNTHACPELISNEYHYIGCVVVVDGYVMVIDGCVMVARWLCDDC